MGGRGSLRARGRAAPQITELEICYETASAVPGRTYISQTRLTEMREPDAAYVRVDDGTDRIDPGRACYRTPVGAAFSGTVTLGLRVVIGHKADAIKIGAIRLFFAPT